MERRRRRHRRPRAGRRPAPPRGACRRNAGPGGSGRQKPAHRRRRRSRLRQERRRCRRPTYAGPTACRYGFFELADAVVTPFGFVVAGDRLIFNTQILPNGWMKGAPGGAPELVRRIFAHNFIHKLDVWRETCLLSLPATDRGNRDEPAFLFNSRLTGFNFAHFVHDTLVQTPTFLDCCARLGRAGHALARRAGLPLSGHAGNFRRRRRRAGADVPQEPLPPRRAPVRADDAFLPRPRRHRARRRGAPAGNAVHGFRRPSRPPETPAVHLPRRFRPRRRPRAAFRQFRGAAPGARGESASSQSSPAASAPGNT